jgi:hypothetical protein
VLAELSQPPLHVLGEGGRNHRLGTLADPPRFGLGDQHPGRKGGGEKLLDHERDTVRARRELHDLVGHGARAEARRHHGSYVLPVERRQLDHRRDPPG